MKATLFSKTYDLPFLYVKMHFASKISLLSRWFTYLEYSSNQYSYDAQAFVNYFCFQKLFLSFHFCPNCAITAFLLLILSSNQKARRRENIQAESCWVIQCRKERVCGRSNNVRSLLNECTSSLLHHVFPPPSFSKSLYTFHLSNSSFFLHFQSAVTLVYTAWIPLQLSSWKP